MADPVAQMGGLLWALACTVNTADARQVWRSRPGEQVRGPAIELAPGPRGRIVLEP